jgi:hypothetical protein
MRIDLIENTLGKEICPKAQDKNMTERQRMEKTQKDIQGILDEFRDLKKFLTALRAK